MDTVSPIETLEVYLTVPRRLRNATARLDRKGEVMQNDASSSIAIGTEFTVTLPWQQGRYEAVYRKPKRRWDQGRPDPYADPEYVLDLLRDVLVALGVVRNGDLKRIPRASWESYPAEFLRLLVVAIDEDLHAREDAAAERTRRKEAG